MKCPFHHGAGAPTSAPATDADSVIPTAIDDVLEIACAAGVATLTLKRPQRMNALDGALIKALHQALDLLQARDDVRALVITGAGQAFCSGADLITPSLLQPSPAAPDAIGEQVREALLQQFNPLIQRLVEYPKVTLCAVNGITAGGGLGLALACDIVVAGSSARFEQVFASRLGLVPDCGLTWQLPRTVGRARATALALLGEPLTAQQAKELGLIWDVVDDTQLIAHTLRLAQQVASNPSHVNHLVKRALRDAYAYSLSEQLRIEADLQGRCASMPAFTEALAAMRARTIGSAPAQSTVQACAA